MENRDEMPMGFVFQLSMNAKAMENFSKMTEAEKRQVLDTARGVALKKEMQSIVSDLEKWN